MAQNKLGIGLISLPSDISSSLKIALEDLVSRVNDNVEYLYKPTVRAVSGDITLTDLDSLVLVDAASGVITVTLPLAATVTGKQLKIKKTDASANAVTVDGNGSETIDGAATYSLASQNKIVCVVSDGSNWYIVANN